MRPRAVVFALVAALMFSCQNREEELETQISQLQSEQLSHQQSILERDQFFEEVVRSVNEVYADLEKARAKEAKITERAVEAEGPARFTDAETRQKLLNKITDIGSNLKENRKKISELQARMKSFHGQVASLNTLVANLKKSLEEREHAIAQLESRVQGLETTVAEKTKEIMEKETTIQDQERKLNTVYFVVGTRKELEEKGIITEEGGFLWGLLGSTTVMASGVDPTLFTALDKTKDHTIRVGGKIDEILPRRNPEYFAMAEPDERSSDLTIVSPDKFWQEDYLVIVVD